MTDDISNWKRLLSGAVALSHCIFHSVTTCSTPSRYQELAAMRNLATCELDKRRHLVTFLYGAVAISHCIFHSVTTCSTPSRCVPLRHDFALQKYALTRGATWWRTIETTGAIWRLNERGIRNPLSSIFITILIALDQSEARIRGHWVGI